MTLTKEDLDKIEADIDNQLKINETNKFVNDAIRKAVKDAKQKNK